jgi:hypothetical protein
LWRNTRYAVDMEERMVLLLGRSLLLAGVAESLGRCDGVRVAHAGTWLEAEGLLTQRIPDVLIFCLADAGEARLLQLLCQNPHLVLVGLDPEHNRGVLLAGEETSALTLQRVREIVAGNGRH